MAKNFSHKDTTAGLALVGVGQKSETIPLHWAITAVEEVGDNVVVTLNFHTERCVDTKFSERNLSGESVYKFSRDEVDAVADIKSTSSFAVPNILGKLKNQCDTLNEELGRALKDTAGRYRDAVAIDTVAFDCFKNEANHEFAWRLKMLAKIEAFIKLASRQYVGHGVLRY